MHTPRLALPLLLLAASILSPGAAFGQAAADPGGSQTTEIPAVEEEGQAKPGFFGYWGSPLAIRPIFGEVLFINRDPGATTLTLNPVLIPILGAALDYPVGKGYFRFQPSFLFYNSIYEYTAAGRAVPGNVEYRSAYVYGILFDLPFLYEFRLGKGSILRTGLGLALNARYGFKAAAEVPDSEVTGINDWLWAKGRWFLPSTHLEYEYQAQGKIRMGAGLLAWWPIFNLWAGEGLGFFDQMMAGFTINLSFALR
jgi:hypothetical protein